MEDELFRGGGDMGMNNLLDVQIIEIEGNDAQEDL